MAPIESIELQVPPGAAGERLDRVLGQAEGFSRSLARKLIDAGAVFVNGARTRRASRPMSPGELIRAPRSLPPIPRAELGPRILHRGEGILVVDKPSGVASAPTPLGIRGTLPWLLSEQLGLPALPIVVHRLDLEVSGVMALALDRRGARLLSKAFEGGLARKHYFAIVSGAPPAIEGEVEAPIGKDPGRRGRMRVAPSGDPARTGYRRQGAPSGYQGCEQLSIRLHTGRTHQIRVHLSHLGCPILGDRFYGGPRRVRSAEGSWVTVPRLCLHSHRLELPLGGRAGELMTFEAPLPELLPLPELPPEPELPPVP
ncbi:MAG: RluA family pseudouridine synthase [Polyangia bacterium]|jgi:23S rRNA pseudouridine1911/1915/1917 synthase|nr:RluA family pseudouridine synthase [Polyangia bacterium]